MLCPARLSTAPVFPAGRGAGIGSHRSPRARPSAICGARVDGLVRLAERRRSRGDAGSRGPRVAGDVGVHARPRRGVRRGSGAGSSCVPERDQGFPAARAAFWIAINLSIRGEAGGAKGWVGRARRLVDREPEDCVERGYLVLADMLGHAAAGDPDAAIAAGREAVAIGDRFADADLFALAAQDLGGILIKRGHVAEGLGLLDEAMVAVTAGELSPMVNGFVYCGVIMGCQAAYEPRRAQEWTAALSRWCEDQPDLVSFTGTCLVHRSEIMQLRGAWPDALHEARRAAERCLRANNGRVAAYARYREGEVHRLRGEFAAAEAAYREAHRGGYEPQPGLALLRLAQGNGGAAAAAIRRLVGETSDPSRRAGLLPAAVEIMLDVGDLAAARGACAELERLAEQWAGTCSARRSRTRVVPSRWRRGTPGGARSAAERDAGVAGARGAVRGGSRAGARRDLLPRARG